MRAGADRGEGAGGRGRLAELVVAPAGEGAVVLDAAGEVIAPAGASTAPAKVPAGGVAWPLLLSPQQATVPFVLSRRCGSRRR